MQTASDVFRYRPPEPSKVALNLRVSQSTRQGLDDLVRLWRAFAEARGDENVESIDLSHVARAVLEQAIEGDFAKFGGRPVDEAGWKTLEAAIRQSVKTKKQR